MISFFLWYIVLLLLGWCAFPLIYTLFPHLSDRGYGLAKAGGLLIFGFLYWILVSLNLLLNTWVGIAGVVVLVFISGVLSASKIGWQNLRVWFESNHRIVLIFEIVFFVLFAFFTFMRAASPEIIGTEKPMELAFINAILRSPSFPPNDPWLSGYAISYYYFGYVIVAGLIRLTGVLSGVGFNLALAMCFALAGLGSFSIVLNILTGLPSANNKISKPSMWKKTGWALFGPILLIFTGNWQGLLEVLHASGTFWKQTETGLQSSFWRWLDIQELTVAPNPPFGFLPERIGGIWWWRASRVLQDYDLVGNSKEIIDEFPFFSLLLADLHPHILAMPFIFLACGIALEFFFTSRSGVNFRTGLFPIVKRVIIGRNTESIDAETCISPGRFWATALVLGGLSFLNTWDFPIYISLVCGAVVLGRYLACGWNRFRLVEFFELAISLGIAGIFLYLPFYSGFSSQAGGLLPSLAFFTRGAHFWVMFGVLLIPIFLGLLMVFYRSDYQLRYFESLKSSFLLILGFWILMLIFGLLLSLLPVLAGVLGTKAEVIASSAVGEFFNLQGSANLTDLLINTSLQRLLSPGAWLTLVALLALVWSGVRGLRKSVSVQEFSTETIESNSESDPHTNTGTLPFVLLLTGLGLGLTIFPEFFYLRDQFGWRMNTIFKFYFQTWILWSMAASAGLYLFWQFSKGTIKVVGGILIAVSLFAGFLYPFYGLYFRFSNLRSEGLTLDGNAYIARGDPDEALAMQFLRIAPPGVVAEAIGGSYSGYARISTQTGQVTVLGWPGHESQWRGGAKELSGREEDIRRLYQSKDWQDTLGIIRKYNIRYIYIGRLENNLYGVNLAKFESNLYPVYRNNSVVIFEIPDSLHGDKLKK
jgi:YYY domain-containing protein